MICHSSIVFSTSLYSVFYYVTIQSDLTLHQIRCDAISIAIRIFTQRIKAIKDMNGSKYQGKSYYIKIDKLLTNTFVYGLLTCIDFLSILEDMCFHLKCKYGDMLELVCCLFVLVCVCLFLFGFFYCFFFKWSKNQIVKLTKFYCICRGIICILLFEVRGDSLNCCNLLNFLPSLFNLCFHDPQI